MDCSQVSISTLELLDGLAREDGEAWERFDERYRPLLAGVLARAGIETNEAEDLAQETLLAFVRKHREGQTFRDGRGVRAWLIRTARARAIDSYRRRKPDVVRDSVIAGMPRESELEALWEAEQEARIFELAVGQLRRTSGLRQSSIRVFELLILEGRSAQEVAGELNLELGAVYTAKHRCMKHLRTFVRELEVAYHEGSSVAPK